MGWGIALIIVGTVIATLVVVLVIINKKIVPKW